MSPASSKRVIQVEWKRKSRTKGKEGMSAEEQERLKQAESAARKTRRLATAEQEKLRKRGVACKRQKTRVAKNCGGDGSGGSCGKGSKGSNGSNGSKGSNSGCCQAKVAIVLRSWL
jgi:hypothetical protein